MTVVTHTPVLDVNGTALPDRWLGSLTGLRVERALGLAGRATIRFSDPGYGLSASNLFGLGKAVTIGLAAGGELMSGDVTGVSLDQTSSGPPDLVVVVHDLAHRLTRSTTVRTFRQVTVSDVLRQLARAHGMAARVVALPATLPYLMQNGTDLAFLEELTARTGTVWWVDGKTLVVAKADASAPVVEVGLGEELTEFSVRASGLRPDEVQVSGWDPTTKQTLVGNATPPPAAASVFVADYAKPGTKLSGTAKIAAADQVPTAAADAALLATSLLQDWSAAAVVGRGSGSVNAAITPGVVVKVKDAGPTSGSYRVSSVEHVYGRTGLTTRFTSGHHRPRGLVDTIGGSAARTSGSGAFSVSGLVVGIVTNIHDQESWGRVRVKFAGLAGEVESEWARVLSVGAGPSRGVVFHPEVNDEVLVGFEHGDPRRPVVLGGLFSSRSAPPWLPAQGANAVDQRRLSSRLGHFIELGDGSAATGQHLLLELASGHRLRLGADRFDLQIAAGKPLLISAGTAKIEFDASGNIAIEGNAISLKATGAITLEGTDVSIKGRTAAKVEATTVSVKGTASTAVEASGSLSLKGGMVAIN